MFHFFPIFAIVPDHNDIWLSNLSKGCNSSYKILFDKYYYRLCSFANKFLDSKEGCEDIVQEIFFYLYESQREFDNEVSLKSYLYTSVKNKCLSILRHQKVIEKYADRIDEKEQKEFFLNALIEEEVFSFLKDSFSYLPEKTKKVFELTVKGYKNEQISEELGLSIDAVKSHKKRGNVILRDKLKDLVFLLIMLS